MAYSDDHKKYVTIENVRAFYKKKDDTIHLSSTDEDVQMDGGFHLKLSRGTQIESTVRELLIEKGVINNDVVHSTSSKGGTGKTDSRIFTAALGPDAKLSMIDLDAKPFTIPHEVSKGSVIAVTSFKGGVGKTDVTISTATALAKRTINGRNLKVCVVDMDTRDGHIGEMLQTASPNMLTLYVGSGSWDLQAVNQELIRSHLVSNPELGVDFLLAPQRSRSADYLSKEFFTRVYATLRTMYDVILLDSSMFNHFEVYWDLIDAAILVTNELPRSRASKYLIRDILKENEQEPSQVGVFFNNASVLPKELSTKPVPDAFIENAVILGRTARRPVANLDLQTVEDVVQVMNSDNDWNKAVTKIADSIITAI
jgi:MinD-like ATPase involved in chromosome partitioning or flagellar assembly